MKETLIKALQEAGNLVFNNYRKTTSFDYKKWNDIVTQADLDSENLIKKIIQNKYPEHNILAEESGELINESDYLWVIDPLDGTKNYACGLPYFCVSIGLIKDDETIMGGVYAPVMNELFFAEKDKGARLNDSIISVNPKAVSDSVITTDFGHYSIKNKELILKSLKEFDSTFRGVRQLGSGALAISYVAGGFLDAYVSLECGKWDKTASTMIAKEAGALVHGSLESKEPIIAASSVEVINKIKEILGLNLDNLF